MPWVRGRGFQRLLALETNISDLLQFLSDRDSSPWENIVNFLPIEVHREATGDRNNADLFLVSAKGQRALVEVKLAHLMDAKQQRGYEDQATEADLYLVALSMDKHRLDGISVVDGGLWRFRSIVDVVDAWTNSADEIARLIAQQMLLVVGDWEKQLTGVFTPVGKPGSQPLGTLKHKFLGRVLTRRMAVALSELGRHHYAGVASGGGVPLIQAWAPIRNESEDRCFMAEVRWQGDKPGGILRFGVDFEPRPGQSEDEEVRRAAHELAVSMAEYLDCAALKGHLEVESPRLAGLIHRKKGSRPEPKGDWEEIIRHGFTGAAGISGKKLTRSQTKPAFYGDGALRFQAMADIDFGEATGIDIVDLLDTTLTYLSAAEPPASE